MELLFKREQTSSLTGRIEFALWGKVELDTEEQAIIKRYRFDEAIMIAVAQPELLRNAFFVGIGGAGVLTALFMPYMGISTALIVAVIAGGGAGYWYFHEKRETIFVKDLIHGRNFVCRSVVELARKEAWLELVSSYLRQVMESAKHWDGTARHTIEPLPKDEARQVVLRGL